MYPEYLFVACLFVGLAIIVSLLPLRRRQSDHDSWLRRGLNRGDLRALSKTSWGENSEILSGQIGRLRRRGFVVEGILGGLRVTVKGRFALIVWRLIQPEIVPASDRKRTKPKSA